MKPLFQDQTKENINSFLSRPSHSLALVGETGAGKGFVADYLASVTLDSPLHKLNNHPYVKKLNCADARVGIEEVREIQQFLTLIVPGRKAVRRTIILENADQLGREAQNALLKTLEETPGDTIIILTIARHDQILPTIHSRLQHIAIQPVTQQQASEYFETSSDAKNIKRAYLISGGLVGLMCAILTDQEEHPLVQAIAIARKTLTQSRYERLLAVDNFTKSKSVSSDMFMNALYKLLYASYKQGVIANKPANELRGVLRRLNLIEQAAFDLDNKVSERLVLSRLFLSL